MPLRQRINPLVQAEAEAQAALTKTTMLTMQDRLQLLFSWAALLQIFLTALGQSQ